VAVVPPDKVHVALAALQGHELGVGAARIGTIQEQGLFPVIMETLIGGLRPVEIPPGELLPRIC
jgi:hydrogenase expression/formation protein HypE